MQEKRYKLPQQRRSRFANPGREAVRFHPAKVQNHPFSNARGDHGPSACLPTHGKEKSSGAVLKADLPLRFWLKRRISCSLLTSQYMRPVATDHQNKELN